MATAFYLDTSIVLRATLEAGTTPEIGRRLRSASAVITSRLSLVEAARVLIRARLQNALPEGRLTQVEREIDAVWRRCDLWELTPSVCELAARLSPRVALRALDALHLATLMQARRKLGDVELLTADRRLAEAAAAL